MVVPTEAEEGTAGLRPVLVVGGGLMGERHIRAFGETSRAALSVCDVDASRLDELGHKYELHGLYDNLDSALEEQWDAVVVATPASAHVPMGTKVTGVGLPVLVEKPLSLTASGIAEWIQMEAQSGAPVMVAYPFRCHPQANELRRLVQSDTIGDPVQVVVSRGANLRARRPNYAATYYAAAESGGGVVFDILSHALNLTEWILGPADWYEGDAGRLVLEGVEVPDTVHVIARHRDVMVSYAIAQHHAVAHFTFEVHGTKGSLRANLFDGTLERSSGPDGVWQLVPEAGPSSDTMLVRQAEVFLEVVDGTSEPPCGLAGGLETIESVAAVIETSTRRARSGSEDVS